MSLRVLVTSGITLVGLTLGMAGPTEPTGFDFFCRGPYQLETVISSENTELSAEGLLCLDFVASGFPAGLDGERLGPGKCAWPDRPLNAVEPRRLCYKVSQSTGASEEGGAAILFPNQVPSTLGAHIIIGCANTNHCVLKFFAVENTGFGFLLPMVSPIIRRTR